MPGGIRRRGKERGEQQAPVSRLRERARDAAEAIHSDNSCRWFSLIDIFPVYNYLYDYYRGRREDLRLRGLAADALRRLDEVAQRLEANAINPLPPEWADARAALAAAVEVLQTITQPW